MLEDVLCSNCNVTVCALGNANEREVKAGTVLDRACVTHTVCVFALSCHTHSVVITVITIEITMTVAQTIIGLLFIKHSPDEVPYRQVYLVIILVCEKRLDAYPCLM